MPGFKQTKDRKHFNSRRTSLTANIGFWSFDHISQGKEKGNLLYAPKTVLWYLDHISMSQ